MTNAAMHDAPQDRPYQRLATDLGIKFGAIVLGATSVGLTCSTPRPTGAAILLGVMTLAATLGNAGILGRDICRLARGTYRAG